MSISSYNLKRHESKHVITPEPVKNVKEFNCNCCAFKTGRLFSLKRHCYTKHPNENWSAEDFTTKKRECQHDGCKSGPIYGFKGYHGLYCEDHKLTGMVNTSRKLCKYMDCEFSASFGPNGSSEYCSIHKTSDMLIETTKRCRYEKCNRNAIYGVLGGTLTHCAKHKTDAMYVASSKQCNREDCHNMALFGNKDDNLLYCRDHKTASMINLKQKICKVCDIQAANSKYKGHCYRCFIYTFPDNAIGKNHKTKESAVRSFVQESFPTFDMIFDKRIEGGCSKRRPDIYIDLGDHVLVIEIDENQHTQYDCTCENKRLMELFTDAGSRPMTMIRFNPDEYKGLNGKKHPSCWDYSPSRGLCRIKKGQQKDWQNRLETLKHHIQFVCDHKAINDVNVVHLFYDGWGLTGTK